MNYALPTELNEALSISVIFTISGISRHKLFTQIYTHKPLNSPQLKSMELHAIRGRSWLTLSRTSGKSLPEQGVFLTGLLIGCDFTASL